MFEPVRVSAGLVGLGIIGCVAHGAVLAAGGYGATNAPMLIALACGLAIGSVAIGAAWRERRYTIAMLIGAGLVAGEAYALLLTGERTLEAREVKQAPLRAAMAVRVKAHEQVASAQRALAGASINPRLERALAAKASADAAVVEKAAERGCASNCRALLEQQVATAAAEVNAARTELAALRSAAAAEFEAARAALAALPAPPSVSPLADRLGLEGWQVDLAAATLASLAANGLGAFLLAFAAHGRREITIDLKPEAAPPARDAAAEADAFARVMFRPAPQGRVHIVEIRETYDRWARTHGLEPLPSREIGAELAQLFASVGLYREGQGANAVIVGIQWADGSAGAAPAVADGQNTTQRRYHLGEPEQRFWCTLDAFSKG